MNTIEITDKKKGKIKMEVVLTYENDNNKYVIYKEIKGTDVYIAKYNDNNDNLDTNLTDAEIEFGQKVLEGAINEIKD